MVFNTRIVPACVLSPNLLQCPCHVMWQFTDEYFLHMCSNLLPKALALYKHIILGVQWAVVGSSACMSVHNRFTVEVYGFTHNLHTFLACAITMED